MLLIIGASFLLLLSVSAGESGSCPEDWTDASFVDMGCLYFNNTERLDWMEANEYCQTRVPELNSSLVELRYALKKNTGLFGNFSQHGGGGLPNSQIPKPKKSDLNHPKITQKTN